MTALNNRYDFVYLFDVVNGNPNGDPDTDNMPRTDQETGHGLVTDVCLKRKIRNFVDLVRNGEDRYNIYVRERAVLNDQHALAYSATGVERPAERKLPKKEEDQRKVRDWMCHNFFDVRTFGAVMTTGVNCGQVRGPVQLAFARSIEPVVPQEVTVTRMAVTTQAEAEKQEGGNRTMGRKYILPYGLYRCEGFVSAHLARQTGFDEADLETLWQALQNMFEHDRSAARGMMAARGLYAFRHATALGNAPAHRLFERIGVERLTDTATPARSFGDYGVSIDRAGLPEGVELLELI
ncbi:MAG: type I-C CRISPR-associated protein Cas7/Csd2 [Desulfovibrionaceae bacterium]|jgi:CRISPR-associated protein Csd2|nr:type I-C CRISPR-associated protein Cas7/Csd2 [Desulfovibrionaceae bacterium]